MNQIAAITWSLATLLSLTACAAYLGQVAGPIGIAVGLYLAPVGAAVGTVVGIAKSTSR